MAATVRGASAPRRAFEGSPGGICPHDREEREMKRKRVLALFAIAVAIATFLPTNASAAPRDFDRQVRYKGNTYLIATKGRCKGLAVMVKAANKGKVHIPKRIAAKGRKYVVRALWGDVWMPKNRIWYIHGALESIEDPAPWDGRVRVVAYDQGMRSWLKRTGVNAH